MSLREKKITRDTNLDLLRIVSMLLIVLIHSIDHSGVLENAENCGTGMYLYVRFVYALCMVCVNAYVLLSGYYLVNSRFRVQKLAALWMETVFYALGLRLVFMLAGARPFSVGSLVSCLFPFLTGRYWFITIYVGLYLVSPFLNMLIHAMDLRQHLALNVCLFGLFSVWSSIHPAIKGMNSGGGWGLAWFVVLYLLAAWLRLYYKPGKKGGLWFAGFFLIPALVALAQLTARQLGIGILQTVIDHWFRYDSVPSCLATLCLFVGFLHVRIQSGVLNQIIAFAAPLTFGVYLIHAQADVSPWLWAALDLPAKMGSMAFPLVQLGVVLAIFVVCILIDAIRKNTVGRLERCEIVRKGSAAIQNKGEEIMTKWSMDR